MSPVGSVIQQDTYIIPVAVVVIGDIFVWRSHISHRSCPLPTVIVTHSSPALHYSTLSWPTASPCPWEHWREAPFRCYRTRTFRIHTMRAAFTLAYVASVVLLSAAPKANNIASAQSLVEGVPSIVRSCHKFNSRDWSAAGTASFLKDISCHEPTKVSGACIDTAGGKIVVHSYCLDTYTQVPLSPCFGVSTAKTENLENCIIL